jgi:hypothetical protein
MMGSRGLREIEKVTPSRPMRVLTNGENRRIKTNGKGLVEGWIALADRDKTYHLKAPRN